MFEKIIFELLNVQINNIRIVEYLNKEQWNYRMFEKIIFELLNVQINNIRIIEYLNKEQWNYLMFKLMIFELLKVQISNIRRVIGCSNYQIFQLTTFELSNFIKFLV